MAHFIYPQKILFKHCDPAGIGFYPRYVEIINDAVEAMFGDLIGWSFAEIIKANGTPTASISIAFKAPCRLGDQITVEITIVKLGRSSLVLKTAAMAGAELRFAVDHVLVCTGENGRPVSWPEPVRKTINTIMEGTA